MISLSIIVTRDVLLCEVVKSEYNFIIFLNRNWCIWRDSEQRILWFSFKIDDQAWPKEKFRNIWYDGCENNLKYTQSNEWIVESFAADICIVRPISLMHSDELLR